MSLSAAQKGAVADFCAMTSCSEKQAQEFLRRAGWKAEIAANAFFDSGVAPEGAPAAPPKKKGSAADDKALEAEFARFAAPGEDQIEGEGLIKLAGELGVDLFSDSIFLFILKHCGPPGEEADAAVKAGKARGGAAANDALARAEFIAGFKRLGVVTVAELRARLPALRAALAAPAAFKAFFEWAFAFQCAPGQKSLPLDVVRELLPVVLPVARFALRAELVAFLEAAEAAPSAPGAHKGVSRDAWALLLPLGAALGPGGDLSKYDDAGAWPVLFDDFVAFAKARKGAAAAGV